MLLLNLGFNNKGFTQVSPGLENIQIPCLFQVFQAHKVCLYDSRIEPLQMEVLAPGLLGSAILKHHWGISDVPGGNRLFGS